MLLNTIKNVKQIKPLLLNQVLVNNCTRFGRLPNQNGQVALWCWYLYRLVMKPQNHESNKTLPKMTHSLRTMEAEN